MAANPLIAQGTLNRLRGSVVIDDNPALNVTAPYLGKEGIRLTLEGESTLFIPTMTGTVTSPEPYQMIALQIHLLKTQSLSDQYKLQMELQSTIGTVVVTPDTSTLSNYQLLNCAINAVQELNFSGEDAGYVVTIKGYYNVNSALWNLN